MSIEVLPVGVTCNLKCSYCYEAPLRNAKSNHRYERDAVLAAIDKLPGQWSLFGGEALILPIEHIEELLKKGFEKWKATGIQTNGTLITEAHMDLFVKYKTHVGLSLDGPDELNDSRWAGTQAATDRLTGKTHATIARLVERSKLPGQKVLLPSIIVTLHAGNCSKDRFPKFVKWIQDLDALGIQYINPHVMELDDKASTLYLNQDELSDRLIDLWNLQETLTHVKFSKFDEVLKLLQGLQSQGPTATPDNVTCHWHNCDPMNTAAVQSVEHDGTPSLCGRTFKSGTHWLPAEGTGYNAPLIGHPGSRHHTRQLALYVTPQEYGGCQGCEFWAMCLGQCPGEGITAEGTADWRMRSSYCLTWKKLFAEGARRLRLVGKKPFCDWKDRPMIEAKMYELWVAGQDADFGRVVKEYVDYTSKGMVPVPGGYHGDHTDA